MMKSRLKLILLILAIVSLLAVSACKAAADEPSLNVVQPNGSFVVDKTNSIGDGTKSYIEQRNYNLQKNCKGAQICVVVLSSTGSEDIMDYGYAVFKEWKIGSSTENNGVLLLLAINDGHYWITPGYGLEDVLDFDVLNSILKENCEPYFDQKDYDTAVRKTFERLNELLCAQYNANPGANVSGYGGFSGNGGAAIPSSGGNSCISLSGLSVSCSACSGCSECSSCSGIGLIILALIVIYVVMQVLRGMGRGASRTGSARSGGADPSGGGGSHSGASGTAYSTGSAYGRASGSGSAYGARSSGTGFRPRAWMFALPIIMKAARRSAMRGPFRGFTGSPFSGTARGPRPGGSFKGFTGGFGGFTGGGGGSRGGGAGRR